MKLIRNVSRNEPWVEVGARSKRDGIRPHAVDVHDELIVYVEGNRERIIPRCQAGSSAVAASALRDCFSGNACAVGLTRCRKLNKSADSYHEFSSLRAWVWLDRKGVGKLQLVTFKIGDFQIYCDCLAVLKIGI